MLRADRPTARLGAAARVVKRAQQLAEHARGLGLTRQGAPHAGREPEPMLARLRQVQIASKVLGSTLGPIGLERESVLGSVRKAVTHGQATRALQGLDARE